MTALQHVKPHAHYTVQLPRSDDFAFWRERARALIQCDIPPDKIAWVEPGGTDDLFSSGGMRLPEPPADAPPVRASKRYLSLASNAALHRDPARFTLLYRLLWRLQRNPRIRL